jgi:hypothetical protein
LLCSLSQDACVAAAGRVMDDTLSADSGTWKLRWRGRRFCLRKFDSGEKKATVFTLTLHATGGFPGSLPVVNSYSSTGKSHSQKSTITFTLIIVLFFCKILQLGDIFSNQRKHERIYRDLFCHLLN